MPLNYYLIYFSVLEPDCTAKTIDKEGFCSACGTLYSLPPQRFEDTNSDFLKSEAT